MLLQYLCVYMFVINTYTHVDRIDAIMGKPNIPRTKIPFKKSDFSINAIVAKVTTVLLSCVQQIDIHICTAI